MSSTFYKSGFIKVLVISICTSALISCDSNSGDQDKSVDLSYIDLRITDNLDILGNWSMCSTFLNGTSVQYNVCKTVDFMFDGNGSVNTEHFTWNLKKGKLNILYAEKDSSVTFPDTTYSIIMTHTGTTFNMTIQQLKGDNMYFLAK